MTNIKGQGRPTIYTKGNKGDIYTDTNTGIKYECLGPDGFVEAGDIEKNKYDWKEIKTSGGGTGGVSSWNDLMDKPFGETIIGERQVCIEPQMINFVQATDMSDNPFPWTSYFFTEDGGLGQAAQTGAAAIVVVDGVEYAFEGQGEDGYVSYFGNKSISDDTVVEPMYPDAKILILLGGMGGNFILYMDTSFIGEHEIAVYAVKSDVTKLGDEYIPGTIARKSDLPHVETKTIMGPTNVTINPMELNGPDGSGMGVFRAYIDAGEFNTGDLVNVNDGDVVTVIYDGVTYEVVARKHDNPSGYILGNVGLYNMWATMPSDPDVDADVPFHIFLADYASAYAIYTQDENPRTLTMYCNQEIVHNPIDEMCIPDTIARKSDVSGVMIVTKEFNSNVLSHSYQEILDALTTRFVVLVSYDNADYPYMQYFSHSDFGDLVFTTYRPYVYDHIADYSTINVWTTVITSENEVYSSSGVINGGTPPNPA